MAPPATDMPSSPEPWTSSEQPLALGLADLSLDALPIGVSIADAQGRILQVNEVARRWLGLSAEEPGDRAIPGPDWKFLRADGSPLPLEDYPGLRALREQVRIEAPELGMLRPDGDVAWLSVTAVPLGPDRVLITCVDRTGTHRSEAILAARARLAERAPGLSLELLLRATLDEAEVLTGSSIGFCHFVNEDQEALHLQAWSTRTEAEFCQAEGRGSHYPVSQAGIWADCVRQRCPVVHNDYAGMPGRKGLPPGHALVVRELTVPVLRAGKVVAILGVGNKARDYTEVDVGAVQRLADLAWDLAEAKRAEESLQVALFGKAPVGIALSRRGIYRQVNATFLRLFGYEHEAEVLGRSLLDTVEASQRERVKASNEIRERTGSGPAEYETMGLRKDGTSFPEQVFVSAVPLADGVGTLAFITDTSERKQFEARLRESEEKFRTYIEQSNDVIFTLDTRGAFVFVSPAWERHFGFPPSEVIGKPFAPFIDPEDIEPCLHYLQSVLSSRQPGTSPPYRVRHADGSWRRFVANGSVIDSPEGAPLFLGVAHDITSEFAAQEALREAHRFNEQVIHGAKEGIIVYGLDLRYQVWNPFMEQLTGVPASRVLGHHPLESFPFLKEAGVIQRLERVLAGEDVKPIEFLFKVSSTSSTGWVRDSLAPLRNTQGRIIGVIGLVADITERKQAEEALLQANVLLEQSQTLTKMGAWTLDVASGQLTWTAETYRLHEVDPREYTPSMATALEFYERGSRPLLAKALEAAMASGERYNLELRLRTAKGRVLWIRTIGTAVFEGGRCVRLLGTLQNITERKEVEDALKESEQQIRVIFEASEAGIILVSSTGHITFANRRMAEIFGMPLGELIGTAYPDHLHASEKQVADARMRKIIRGEIQSVSVERKFLRADGSDFWGHLSGRRLENPDGSLRALVGVITDITERKLAAEALRVSEDRLRLTLEATGIGSWDWDLAKDTWITSPIYHEMLGYRAEASASDRGIWLDRVHPDDREAVRGKIESVLAGKARHYLYEARFRHADGTLRWMQTIGFVVESDETGKPIRMVGIRKDVTELKQAEEDRTMLLSQLHQAQKMESLGSLAGGVAHDMNNVLGAILGLASAHIEAQPLGSPTQKALETIIKAAERGGNMLKSLLSFARQNSAEEQVLDLNAILREEVRLLERTTLAKVQLGLDLAPDLHPVRGDAGALTHAFMNLCVNAVDAMPESGTLTLRTRNLSRDWVEVRVQDTGIGMAKEILGKAMDPFFTTKEVGKGTGLGLSIVYSTVKTYRGEMELQSEPGRGTSVILRFPAIQGAGRPAEPSGAYQTMPRLGSLRVLLVDDDELIQSSMQGMLELLGHEATSARSGEEALELLKDGLDCEVVILDMNMPGLGGAGTLPRLRGLRPRLPVLLATGRADQAAQDLVQAHPFVTLLSKPFGMKELQAHLAPFIA